MSKAIELVAKTRTDIGKGASRRLRRNVGAIPAIVYGAGKDPVKITLDHNQLLKEMKNEAFFSSLLSLKIDEKPEKVIVKDIHRHPFKPQVMHMDFLRIKAGEKITMEIPLHFINEDIAKGVKVGGGVITHYMNEVEISCMPEKLPEHIEVDLADVELGQMLHLSDIKLPTGVELIADLEDEDENVAVVSIHTQRVVEEVDESAPEAPETEITAEKAEEEKAGE